MTMLGKKHSDITKQKIRAKLIGRRWRPIRLCPICGKDGVRVGRKYCSQKCYGISERGKISPMKGKKFGAEFRKKVSEAKKGKRPHNYGKPNYKGRGKNCHLWKGGVTKLNAQVRTSIEYKNWRRAVFERDDYTCQKCEERNGDKEVHHIKSFAQHPELRFKVSNGITLCPSCHKQTDTYLKNLR